jgi:hypothetical protein
MRKIPKIDGDGHQLYALAYTTAESCYMAQDLSGDIAVYFFKLFNDIGFETVIVPMYIEEK